MAKARVVLPDSWLCLWKELPGHYINKRLHNASIREMEPLDVDAIYAECRDEPYSFIKTKTIVFCIVQAYIASDRGITQEMAEPEPLPDQIQNMMRRFAELCHCPNYCTLTDMSLTASILTNGDVDLLNCTFDDFKLICPVHNAPSQEEETRHDYESASIRGQTENRFHNTPTMLEYRVSDLVDIIVNTQRAIHDYRMSLSAKEQERLIEEILHEIKRAKASFQRLWKVGLQTPCVHLIDAFLGRKSFATELSKTTVKAFEQLQHYHQRFILSVANGPQLRDFAEECLAQHADHPVVVAFNDLVDSYTRGFLAMHKGRAIEFVKVGFAEAGPRPFTAKTEYEWASPNNAVGKLKHVFEEAAREHQQVRVA
ncbi:hypothetical protein BGW42_005576 [Actinomortierella wolfii]|nr:hypothetical protein BGW42_005576 [Actinomortierella wolfii]